MNIYVGNLNHQVKENELSDLFSEYGTVSSVKIIKDFETGKSRGFAFVEMEDESEANQAIESLHETEFRERPLVVNKARPKTEGGNGGFGGGNRPRRDFNSNNRFNKKY